MPKIVIDQIEYNSEDLTDHGKAQLASLQFLDQQMKQLRIEIAVFNTAKQAYTRALKELLEK